MDWTDCLLAFPTLSLSSSSDLLASSPAQHHITLFTHTASHNYLSTYTCTILHYNTNTHIHSQPPPITLYHTPEQQCTTPLTLHTCLSCLHNPHHQTHTASQLLISDVYTIWRSQINQNAQEQINPSTLSLAENCFTRISEHIHKHLNLWCRVLCGVNLRLAIGASE